MTLPLIKLVQLQNLRFGLVLDRFASRTCMALRVNFKTRKPEGRCGFYDQAHIIGLPPIFTTSIRRET